MPQKHQRETPFAGWMRRHGVSISQAAEETGLSARTISYAKKGCPMLWSTIDLLSEYSGLERAAFEPTRER